MLGWHHRIDRLAALRRACRAEVAGRLYRASYRHMAHFTLLLCLFVAAAYKSEVRAVLRCAGLCCALLLWAEPVAIWPGTLAKGPAVCASCGCTATLGRSKLLEKSNVV